MALGGRVAAKADKPKDYEPTTGYRLSCRVAVLSGKDADLPVPGAANEPMRPAPGRRPQAGRSGVPMIACGHRVVQVQLTRLF